nr:hypothetical protein [uncultured Fluviicola sp.]
MGGFFLLKNKDMVNILGTGTGSGASAVGGTSQQAVKMNSSFIGNIVDAVPQLTAQFNTKYQSNQLQIAEANARAAEASATGANAPSTSNTIIWVAVIIAVLIIAYMLMTRKS